MNDRNHEHYRDPTASEAVRNVSMEKSKLEQFRANLKEIDRLEIEIRKIRLKPHIGTDIVKGSSDEYPYCERSFTVQGIDTKELNRLTVIYVKRLNKLIAEKIEVERWINGVENSVIRQIVQYRYLDGKSWNTTATKVYGYPCGDRARMALKIYLKKN